MEVYHIVDNSPPPYSNPASGLYPLSKHLKGMIGLELDGLKIVDWDDDRNGYLVWRGWVAKGKDNFDDDSIPAPANPACTREEATAMLRKCIAAAKTSEWHLKYPIKRCHIQHEFVFIQGD